MNNPAIRTQQSARRGLATIEFVMIFPFLFLMLITIVWLGFSLIVQSDVTVIARNQAWRNRHDTRAGRAVSRPFFYLSEKPLSHTEKGRVSVSPIFDSASPPASTHFVLGGGTWDHNQISMDSSPNWKRYAQVGASSKSLGIQGAFAGTANVADLDRQFNPKEAIGNAIRDEVESSIKEILKPPSIRSLLGF